MSDPTELDYLNLDSLELADDFASIETEGGEGPPGKTNILRNHDYTLNSAITGDYVHLIIKTLKGHEDPRTIVDTPKFKGIIRDLKRRSKRFDWDWGWEGWTSKIFQFFSQSVPKSGAEGFLEEFLDWVKEREFLWKELLPFVNELGGEDAKQKFTKVTRILHSKAFKQSPAYQFLKNYSVLVKEATIIVHAMNSLDRLELENLGKTYPDLLSIEDSKYANGALARVKSGLFQGAILYSTCAVLPSLKILASHEVMLMIKDIALCRFNTVLESLTASDEQGPVIQLPRKLIDVYHAGDVLLAHGGNTAYDAIKFLEPTTVAGLVTNAEKLKPEVPTLDEFSDFVEGQIRDLVQRFGSTCREFFNRATDFINPQEQAYVFGCFRHWGHPVVMYKEGLRALHEQVTMVKKIDLKYVNQLASDLAKKLLILNFNRTGTWAIDLSKLSAKHPLHPFVKTQTRPPEHVQYLIGDKWHELPIQQMFAVAEVIDIKDILDDKSHSVTREEFKKHLRTNPTMPLAGKKVLMTALKEDTINQKEFLEEINRVGLEEDHLIIGLKEKERELKRIGRFFALMSYKLRLYFVLTEGLLARDIVPLFDALTMTDSLNKVFKKLKSRTKGHGEKNSSTLTMALHLDYSKWNNHQRREATNPVFRVLGQVYGLPKLFCRTHEFFEKSWVYYGRRIDQIKYNPATDSIESRDPHVPYCWNGQAGGLEGLRQKGWSILSLLMLERSRKFRNMKTQILAQGDNQVVCMTYVLEGNLDPQEKDRRIRKCIKNVSHVKSLIEQGALQLGLIINPDETVCSSNFLIYGKVPIYSGNMLMSASKRWARVSATTNDQLPSLANLMSTVSTNALTVAQHSPSMILPLSKYILFSLLVCYYYSWHSPALRGKPSFPKEPNHQKTFFMRVLFLDPSLGGICGTSPVRFLIRQFPDAVTESLTFWRKLYLTSKDPTIRQLCISSGNPPLSQLRPEDFQKLIEDPTSLNIPGTLSVVWALKQEIKTSLRGQVMSIKNPIIKGAILEGQLHENMILYFLRSIKPLFPRFLSEFYSATITGISDSIISLFQNSRTIRILYKGYSCRDLESISRECEALNFRALKRDIYTPRKIWTCSASQADWLRKRSWGSDVYGATVPHPWEMMLGPEMVVDGCQSCVTDPPHIKVHVSGELDLKLDTIGPYPCYLGSSTSSSTQLFHHWVTTTTVPLLKRAFALREAIHWFVDPDSFVAKAIGENLYSLTGERIELTAAQGYKRTGSALHRFRCSRQSDGGFSAISFNFLTYLFVTADQLVGVTQNARNWDFMFQSCMLLGQLQVSERLSSKVAGRSFHCHISCRECLRPIDDVFFIEAERALTLPDFHEKISSMIPTTVEWATTRTPFQVKSGDWDQLSPHQKSFQIGAAQGIFFGSMILTQDVTLAQSAIFPISVFFKIVPRPYLLGIYRGLIASACVLASQKYKVVQLRNPRDVVMGQFHQLVRKLSSYEPFQAIVGVEQLAHFITKSKVKIPASYPSTDYERGRMLSDYFFLLSEKGVHLERFFKENSSVIWIFADCRSPKMQGLFIVSQELYKILAFSERLDPSHKASLRGWKDLLGYALTFYEEGDLHTQLSKSALMALEMSKKSSSYKWTNHETRHAVPYPEPRPFVDSTLSLTRRFPLVDLSVDLSFEPISYVLKGSAGMLPPCPRFRCSLISGLRLVQLATGAHYKLRPILQHFVPSCQLALVGGDGSGGLSRLVLTMYPSSRVVFNSLFASTNIGLSGVTPMGPSAVVNLPDVDKRRCINLHSSWEYPSDLSNSGTWDYLMRVVQAESDPLDLIIVDAEARTQEEHKLILRQTLEFISRYEHATITLVFKSYCSLFSQEYQPLEEIGRHFKEVFAVTTYATSSFSSEVYIVARKRQSSDCQLFVSSFQLKRVANISFCYRTPREELDRARNITPEKMLQGFLPQEIPNYRISLWGLLSSVGIFESLAHQLTYGVDTKYLSWSEYLGYLLGISGLASLTLFPIHRTVKRKLAIPSDPSLRKYLGLFKALLYFVAWRFDNDAAWKRGLFLDNSRVLVFYRLTPVSKQESTIRWKLVREPEWLSKEIYGMSLDSSAEEWIRVLVRAQPVGRLKINYDKMAQYFTSVVSIVSTRLSWGLFLDKTDVLLPVRGALVQSSSAKPLFQLENVELADFMLQDLINYEDITD